MASNITCVILEPKITLIQGCRTFLTKLQNLVCNWCYEEVHNNCIPDFQEWYQLLDAQEKVYSLITYLIS